jgi:hypothetical protein
MAAHEMYDYLETGQPDWDTAIITIKAKGTVTEESSKAQVIHFGVDGSEERISYGSKSAFYISWDYSQLSETDAGTIFDLYNDPLKANAKQRTFMYTHGDGHTYICRFDCNLTRKGRNMLALGFPSIRLKVLARVDDSNGLEFSVAWQDTEVCRWQDTSANSWIDHTWQTSEANNWHNTGACAWQNTATCSWQNTTSNVWV